MKHYYLGVYGHALSLNVLQIQAMRNQGQAISAQDELQVKELEKLETAKWAEYFMDHTVGTGSNSLLSQLLRAHETHLIRLEVS